MAPLPSAARLRSIHDRLLEAHGPQHWWPGDGAFEVMAGAVLTQNTAWANVEKALANLAGAAALSPEAILRAPASRVATWLRPSGFFNVKARRLRALCRWLVDRGGVPALETADTATLREELLAVDGVGPETADSILLYGLGRPVFVIDAYTRRILSRLGLVAGTEPYEDLRALFERRLPRDEPLYNEYHALIVRHAKEICRPKPRCGECVLRHGCRGRLRE